MPEINPDFISHRRRGRSGGTTTTNYKPVNGWPQRPIPGTTTTNYKPVNGRSKRPIRGYYKDELQTR
ncbi:hypothetical protein CR513_19305, partial [Mucuna pruriens]